MLRAPSGFHLKFLGEEEHARVYFSSPPALHGFRWTGAAKQLFTCSLSAWFWFLWYDMVGKTATPPSPEWDASPMRITF